MEVGRGASSPRLCPQRPPPCCPLLLALVPPSACRSAGPRLIRCYGTIRAVRPLYRGGCLAAGELLSEGRGYLLSRRGPVSDEGGCFLCFLALRYPLRRLVTDERSGSRIDQAGEGPSRGMSGGAGPWWGRGAKAVGPEPHMARIPHVWRS